MVANEEMKEAKKGVAVFCPVAGWLMWGGVVVLRLGWGFLSDEIAEWKWAVFMVAVWGLVNVKVPVVVVGRESLWLVRALGVYWKRIKGRDLRALLLVSGGERLLLRTTDDVLELVGWTKRGNRRVAEALHGRFGVGIREEG